MDTQPAFGLKELLTHVIGDIAKALSERDGESPRQQFARAKAAADMILEFRPRNAIEAMLAGHCVMFHELIANDEHSTMRGEAEATRRGTRRAIVTMDRAFGGNLTRLERYQAAEVEASPEAQPEDSRAETEIADRVSRHQSETQARKGDTGPNILHYPAPGTAAGPGADEAMAQIAGLNRQARRDIDRRARKHGAPGGAAAVGRHRNP